MIRLFANRKDFNVLPVSQNEKGWFYGLKTNLNKLWKTVIANFDVGKGLPDGYERFKTGSHVQYPAENGIDFSLVAGTEITASESLKLNGLLSIKGYSLPYGGEFVYGNWHPRFIHIKIGRFVNKKWAPWKVGERIPAGQVIGVVMSPEENLQSGRFSVINGKKVGFPSHLHACNNPAGKFDKMTMRQAVLSPISQQPVPTPTPIPVPVPDPVVETVPKTQFDDLKAQYDTAQLSITDLVEKLRVANSNNQDRDATIKNQKEAIDTLMSKNGRYSTVVTDISRMLGVDYDNYTEWGIKKRAYEVAISEISEKKTVTELFGIIFKKVMPRIVKLFTKKDDSK